MDFNAKYMEKLSSHLPLFFHENNSKPKDSIDQFSLGFLQDLHSLEKNNVNLNGSLLLSSLLSIHQNSLVSFQNSSFGYLLPNFESKPFGTLATNKSTLVSPMDNNFNQSEGNLGHSQSYNNPFNFCEYIPMKYKPLSDEDSCTNPKTDPSLTLNSHSTTNMVRREGSGCKKNADNVVKGQWTTEEDRLLYEFVERYGVSKWSQVAQMINGRVGKQCRERWNNHLRPHIKKDVWSEEEDTILIKAHSEMGNKWAEIAKKLPGRTENTIKNHWNATKRKQFAKRKCRSKYPKQSSLLQEYIKNLTLETLNAGCRKKPLSFSSNTNDNDTTKSLNYSSPSPEFDFIDVPYFNCDAQVFEEGSIDSLLDYASNDNDKQEGNQIMDDFQFDLMHPMVEVQPEIKRELDFMELINQVNF